MCWAVHVLGWALPGVGMGCDVHGLGKLWPPHACAWLGMGWAGHGLDWAWTGLGTGWLRTLLAWIGHVLGWKWAENVLE
jgi:hypothetical protein